MSFYGSEIIDRLHPQSGLRRTGNSVARLVDDGVGGLLDSIDRDDFFDVHFMSDAVGGYLDVVGGDFGVPRKLGEEDEDYRSRIVYECLGHLTVPYLRDVYGVELYTSVSGTGQRLRSDNPFLVGEYGLCIVCSDEVKSILVKKFVLDMVVEWVVV